MALTATARRRGERAVLLAAALAASVAVASVAILLASGRSAEAAFPGKNGEIAFVSTRDGNEEIYVVDADGTNETRLTDEPGRDIHPMFSPDGNRLTFTRRPLDGGVTEETIHVMDPMDVDPADGDGDNPIRLTPAPLAQLHVRLLARRHADGFPASRATRE